MMCDIILQEGVYIKMKKYIPKIYQKSIYNIDYSKLLNRGIKCILFDLDNTLISSKKNEKPTMAKKLIIELKKKGFEIIIFSNSPRKKVYKYMDYFGVYGIYLAFKPLHRAFKKVLKQTGYQKSEIAIIGDQILTDVVGGNTFGITTILVNPINENDLFITNFNRKFENKIIRKLSLKNLFNKGEYYD